MNTSMILSNVSRGFYKVKFSCKKHAPEALIVSGVIGIVGSAVMACKATTKLSSIKEKRDSQIEEFKAEVEKNDPETYSVKDCENDIKIVNAKTTLEYIKLYAPSVILGAVSIAAVISSNVLLHKRNIALAAAYATIDKSFKGYRSRVIERFGKELDRELKYNIKSKEVTETVVNEKGKEKTVTKSVKVMEDDVNPYDFSDYARVFDEHCPGWCKDAEANLVFVKTQMALANKMLKDRGYLFLNEVYELLGFQKTSAGQVVGWTYNKECPNGDNYVDFGFYNINRPKARDFVNGYERSVILDFNVDGNILGMM